MVENIENRIGEDYNNIELEEVRQRIRMKIKQKRRKRKQQMAQIMRNHHSKSSQTVVMKRLRVMKEMKMIMPIMGLSMNSTTWEVQITPLDSEVVSSLKYCRK